MSEGIACVQSLKAYNDPSCSFLIESVIVGVILFQWQYLSLCPAMGFDLCLSSVNFGASGLSNGGPLVSPDCHFPHLKGFCSLLQECISALFQHFHSYVPIHPGNCQWSFSAEPPSRDCLCSVYRKPYPLPALLVSSSYKHLICVCAQDAVSRGCVHVRVIHILPWWLWVQGSLIPNNLWITSCSPIFQIEVGPSWTGGGTDWFLPSLFDVGPSSQYQFGCILITQCRAVFIPSFDLLGVNAVPLVAMIVEWTTGRVTQFFLSGNS